MKGSTKATIVIGGTGIVATALAAFFLATPSKATTGPTPTVCPNRDQPANSDGSCQSGYVPDPDYPGCCMLSTIIYDNTLTADKILIQAGDSVDFTALIEQTINGVKSPLSGIPVTFLEDVTQNEGTLTTDSTGKATMSIKFSNAGTFTVHAAAKSTDFCAQGSTSACELDSGTIDITVTSASPPPPPSYTCYVGHCKTVKLPGGGSEEMCVASPYTSTVPCVPGENDTPTNACKKVTCQGSSGPTLSPFV